MRPQTVARWRGRLVRDQLEGLSDDPRPGAPRTITDERVQKVIVKTLEEAPPNQDSHWSTRSMARATGMSQSAVSRIWRPFGLRPHLEEAWKLSTDPQFIEKVRNVVGLYLNPSEKAPHKTPVIKNWLPRHPRFHLNFSPTRFELAQSRRALVS